MGREDGLEPQKGIVLIKGLSCARGTTPISEKTLRECRVKCKYFMWVRGNPGNRSESCSENCGFRIDQVVKGHSENGISYSENGISNSESCSENTPELSESSENGPFTPRGVFLEIGVVPRLLRLFSNISSRGFHGFRGSSKYWKL